MLRDRRTDSARIFRFEDKSCSKCGVRKRAEYGFGEYGFKHRTQWVFRGSLSFGERTQWVPLSLLFVCKRELTEFVAELTEFAAELSEAQWVFSSETVLSKQYSARFLGVAREKRKTERKMQRITFFFFSPNFFRKFSMHVFSAARAANVAEKPPKNST